MSQPKSARRRPDGPAELNLHYQHPPHINEILQTAGRSLTTLGQQLERLDQLIGQYRILIDTIQPWAPGRIGIRYIRPRGDGPKTPHFIVWKRLKSKLNPYDVVPIDRITRRIPTYRIFAPLATDLRLLLNRVKPLLQERRELIALFTQLQRSLGIREHHARPRHTAEGDWLTKNYPGIADRHLARLDQWRADKATAEMVARAHALPAALPDTRYQDDDQDEPPLHPNTPTDTDAQEHVAGEALPDPDHPAAERYPRTTGPHLKYLIGDGDAKPDTFEDE
jgi:hypothetical protein